MRTRYPPSQLRGGRTYAIDSGVCLITRQLYPIISVQACHILRRKTLQKMVDDYKRSWKAEDIDIDSTANLVSLRADWHASYDANCWAFVPSEKLFKKIEKYIETGSFKTPYPGYKTLQNNDYVFVPFPTLGLNHIIRDNHDHTDVDIFRSQTNSFDFPMLKHHSHPYFVIANALPKFQEHVAVLTVKQFEYYASMIKIEAIWRRKRNKSPSQPIRRKRKRKKDDPDNESSDEEKGGPDTDEHKNKGRQSRHKTAKKPVPVTRKGDGRQLRQLGIAKCARTPRASYRSATDNNVPYFNKSENIVAWIDSVVAAGPLETVREDVVKQDGEISRPPFCGDWHKWCFPWTQPPEHSMYSSNDWAMQIVMFKLTAEPRCWDDTSEDGSDMSESELEVSWSS